jgi:hypothetical protein
MRQLSLQEVNHISGGVAAATGESYQDGIKWVTSTLGAIQGYLSASPLFSYTAAGVNIGKFGVGGLGGAVGAVACYFLGKLLTDNVVKPYVG